MNKVIVSGISTALLSSLLFTSGCSSSSSDSSPGSGTGGTATVPANAITLDSKNAESTVGTSVTTANALGFVLSAEAAPAIGLKDAMKLIESRIKSMRYALDNSGSDPVYGAAVSESGSCNISGTFAFTGDESNTPPNFKEAGTATLVNCDDGDGAILNGNFSWSQTWNTSTGEYNDTLTGSFSVEFNIGGTAGKFIFSGVDYAETGNELNVGSETYNIARATFSVDMTGGGGFLVKLSAPIVESVGGYSHCPESGGILITGAGGTTAEGIYNGDGTMTIKANGTIVTETARCYI
jgi:hypothetical protein